MRDNHVQVRLNIVSKGHGGRSRQAIKPTAFNQKQYSRYGIGNIEVTFGKTLCRQPNTLCNFKQPLFRAGGFGLQRLDDWKVFLQAQMKPGH